MREPHTSLPVDPPWGWDEALELLTVLAGVERPDIEDYTVAAALAAAERREPPKLVMLRTPGPMGYFVCTWEDAREYVRMWSATWSKAQIVEIGEPRKSEEPGGYVLCTAEEKRVFRDLFDRAVRQEALVRQLEASFQKLEVPPIHPSTLAASPNRAMRRAEAKRQRLAAKSARLR